jgi:hypothetical protein
MDGLWRGEKKKREGEAICIHMRKSWEAGVALIDEDEDSSFLIMPSLLPTNISFLINSARSSIRDR